MERLRTRPSIRWPRLVGSALIATALLGIVLSLAGMLLVGRAGATAQGALARQLMTLDRALVATAEGLTIVDAALIDAGDTLEALSSTVREAGRAIEGTEPTLDTLEQLTVATLPESIESTRQALASAQATARVADGVLSTLSIFGVNYNPEVPLNVAIERVADSLAPVPEALTELGSGLGETRENLRRVTADLAEVSAGLDAIKVSLDESQGVVEQYQQIVGDLRGEVVAVAEAGPGWIRVATWGVFLLLAWMALAQIGLLAQGWEMMGRTGD